MSLEQRTRVFLQSKYMIHIADINMCIVRIYSEANVSGNKKNHNETETGTVKTPLICQTETTPASQIQLALLPSGPPRPSAYGHNKFC